MSLALKMAANYQPFFLLNQLFIYNFVVFFFVMLMKWKPLPR